MIDNRIQEYILQFLCGEHCININKVFAYANRENIPSDRRIVIIQSNFFDVDQYGKRVSNPELPLRQLDGVPILFGEDKVVANERQVIIYADLLASTYYLISRYEEWIKPEIRDKYGRFPGKDSLPYRAGFLTKPIVDEYGGLLRKYMRQVGIEVSEPQASFSKIYLTHDVDLPWQTFSITSGIKRILADLLKRNRLSVYPLLNMAGNPRHDPQYSFKYLIHEDKKVPGAKSIYFIKSGGNHRPEDDHIYIHERAFKGLQHLLETNNAILGYHVSYEAGIEPKVIPNELDILKQRLGKGMIKHSRNHFLCSREPTDFRWLIQQGITDDFTMGYADRAGFRLGTCRAVRWIDPEKRELTNLILHPLTIMDCTLTSNQYMNLDHVQSAAYGKALIDQVVQNHGEVCLLWHNYADTGSMKSVDWQNYLSFTAYIKNVSSKMRSKQ